MTGAPPRLFANASSLRVPHEPPTPLRTRATRIAIDAADSLARHLYHKGETDQAIGLLEHATTAVSPYTESLYQLLIQMQRKQGRPKLLNELLIPHCAISKDRREAK
jgi:hypothetical protein